MDIGLITVFFSEFNLLKQELCSKVVVLLGRILHIFKLACLLLDSYVMYLLQKKNDRVCSKLEMVNNFWVNIFCSIFLFCVFGRALK